MHVTSTKSSMEVWLSHHEPIVAEPVLADYEDFLLEQLAANPSIGKTALCTAIRKAKGVTFKEAPIRTWLAARKGTTPMPIAGQASSSSAAPMALLDLSGLDQHGDFFCDNS